MGYIYLRKNLTNGKCYVGQTVDIERRQRDWKNLNWEYGGVLIERARAKYGADGFSFEILKECPNEDMNYWEKYYVKLYNSKKPYGYNSTDGGDSIYEITEETRKKMSEARRGKEPWNKGKKGIYSEEHKKKMSEARRGKPKPKVAAAMRGKKQSSETIEKRVTKLRGKKRSEETKLKIAAAMRGKKLSDEAKAKISAAHMGKKRPDISAALKGRKLSDEAKAKMSAARRGRKLAEETKEKIAAAQKNDPKKSKVVQALDKNGNVVMEFPSAREAERQYGFDSGSISHCCLGKVKTHKGFIWRFAV